MNMLRKFILNFQFRHHEHGRVESRLDTDIYFFCIVARFNSSMFMFI